MFENHINQKIEIFENPTSVCQPCLWDVLAHFFVLLFVSTTYQFIVYTLHYTVTPKSDQNIG
jgi:hypothetical protein